MALVVDPTVRLPLDALMDAVEDGIIVFEPARRGRGPRVVHANATYACWVGRSRAEITGKPLGSMLNGVHPEDRHTLENALDEGRDAEVRLDHATPDGTHPMRLRLVKLPDGLWAAILRDQKPLRDLEANLVDQASHDGLTGLLNRRAWTEQATGHFRASQRYARPLALMMLDLDHFKHINDQHGHATGDAVLKAVCGACRGAVRRVDVLGRIGGEELALVTPETGIAGASTLAVRICNAVRRVQVSGPQGPVQVTVSIGVTERSVVDDELPALMARADAALFQAKTEGRDRVVVA